MTQTHPESAMGSIADRLTGDIPVDTFHMKAYSHPWYVVAFPINEIKLRKEAIKSLDNLLKRQGYQKTGQQGDVIALGGQYPSLLRSEMMQIIRQYSPDVEWTECTYNQYLDNSWINPNEFK